MTEINDNGDIEQLPQMAIDYIELVLRKMGYRRKVRAEVRDELIDHFLQALKDCDSESDKVEHAQELIADFGDPKVLGKLMRRGKKRCRPLWKKVVMRCLAVAGVLLLICLLRVGHLAIGRPSISVDYAAWLNNLGSGGKDESLNSKPYYDKATELLVDDPESLQSVYDGPDKFKELNPDEVKRFLDKIAPAFDAIRAGAEKPYYWANYSVGSDINPEQFPSEIVESQMGFLGAIRRLAQSWNYYQFPWDMSNGNVESAMHDCIAFRRLGQHLSGRGLLIEQLVAIAIEAVAMANIETVLRDEQLSSKQLARLQEEIERVIPGQKHPFDMQAEKAFLLDYVQRTYTDDGNGNGRVLLKGLPLVTIDIKGGLSGFVLFNYPDRREATEMVEFLYAEFNRVMRVPPCELNGDNYDIFESPVLANAGTMMRATSLSISKVRSMSWRIQTNRKALAIICAIFRYKQQHNEFPSRLGDLVDAELIEELPIDPYSGEPLLYKATEGDFILYSVGENMKDDGGVYGINNNTGKPRRYSESGDFVYWPALPN